MPRAATHTPIFTMGDGLCSKFKLMVPPPRAFIHSELGTGEDKCWKMISVYGYMNPSTTGKSRAAPASAPILVGLLWCTPVSLVLRLFTLSGDPSTSALEQGKPACALQLNSIVTGRICLLRHWFHSLPMVRKRGRPRRGVAWDARKAQR
jgi:hypothetical protein